MATHDVFEIFHCLFLTLKQYEAFSTSLPQLQLRASRSLLHGDLLAATDRTTPPTTTETAKTREKHHQQ